ncbi:hypothetical protein MKEN_00405400 [Mycena kentingensis (nom. inval.)]|nr:hypothetical protein MKEN_00405400 [Mycena kentingensis (nom. inval.)]
MNRAREAQTQTQTLHLERQRKRRSVVLTAVDGLVRAIDRFFRLFAGHKGPPLPRTPEKSFNAYEAHQDAFAWLQRQEALQDVFEEKVLELLVPMRETMAELAQNRDRRETLPEYTSLAAIPPPDLPPAPQLFYGRDEEVAALAQALTTPARQHQAIVVSGPSGIGKSALALAVLHRNEVVAHYGARRFLVEECGDGNGDLLFRLRAMLGITGPTLGDGDPEAELLSRIVSMLRACPFETLLVFDDADAATDTQLLLSKLAAVPRTTILITTRVPPALASISTAVIHLAPLAPPAARALFQAIADLPAEGERELVDPLLAYTRGVPQAVVILAQRAQYEPLAFLLADYRQEDEQQQGRACIMAQAEILPFEGATVQGSLRPITSYTTTRYETTKFVETYPMEVAPGLFSESYEPEPPYLPANWSVHIQPEGNRYFFLAGDLRVVTCANLYDKPTLETTTGWIYLVKKMIPLAGIVVTPNVELFLQPEDGGCGYYLVDHATRTQFWLEKCDTETLGLPDLVSQPHLRLALEWLYWAHLEYFPMHAVQISRFQLEELIAIFGQSLCDQMTSAVSTFGYSAPQCETLIRLLESSRATLSSGSTRCSIARLWGVVCHHRMWNHYGQEQARLSRDQQIFYPGTQSENKMARLSNLLTFGGFAVHEARLNDVFTDGLVNSVQWPTFVQEGVEGWKFDAAAALCGISLHLPFIFVQPICPTGPAASALLLAISASTSAFLYSKFKPMERFAAEQARDYLCTIESSLHRFAPAALVLALPRALCAWGFIAFAVEVFLAMAVHFGGAWALFAGAAVSAYLFSVYIVIYRGVDAFRAMPALGFLQGRQAAEVEAV